MTTKSKQVKWTVGLSLIAGGFTLAMAFTNCDQSSSNPVFVQESQTCLNDDKTPCFSANEDAIGLRILNTHPYEVDLKWSQFSISGTCNHGGFTNHSITWQLFLNDSSSTPITQSNGRSPNSNQEGRCINGRFFVTVILQCPGLRANTGSDCSPTTRTDHTLRLKLVAKGPSGTAIQSQIGSSVSIILTPKNDG